MSIFEYDEELHYKTLYEEGFSDCEKKMTKIITEKDNALAKKDNTIAELTRQLEELKAKQNNA